MTNNILLFLIFNIEIDISDLQTCTATCSYVYVYYNAYRSSTTGFKNIHIFILVFNNNTCDFKIDCTRLLLNT